MFFVNEEIRRNGFRCLSAIGLITVLEAILASRQPREKLQCLYGNLMWGFPVYLGVRTCELFLCFALFVFLRSIVLTSLFLLCYVTCEFNRFLHRG